jgi:hypothetical protein
MDNDTYLTTAELAARLRVSPQYLRVLRMRHTGPKFVRISRTNRGRCLYSARDVEAWLLTRTVDPERDGPPPAA